MLESNVSNRKNMDKEDAHMLPNDNDPAERFRKIKNNGAPANNGQAEGQDKVSTQPVRPAKKITLPEKSQQNPDEQPTVAGNPEQAASASTSAASTRPAPPPGATDALPRHVDETDLSATRVSPSAYYQNGTAMQNHLPLANGKTQPPHRGKNGRKAKSRNLQGCLIRGIILFLFALVLGLIIAAAVLVYQYFAIASTLPSVADIKASASQFETTRFYDRNGNVIYEMLDPNAGRRTYIPLEEISPYVLAATIATEDKEFYIHPGFDPAAIARALIQNYTSGEVVSGASTITQQLARALFMDASERTEQSYKRKAREIILAAEIERRYSKDDILELYLNEIYYGNMAYGIEAAAETYFNTTADQLTLEQAAFLAGLPQSPAIYDIFSNREATLNRDKQVLTLMYQMAKEHNCITVSNSAEPVCLEAQQAADAYIAIENYPFTQKTNPLTYPHWVMYIRALLEAQYDAQTIYHSGFQVYTTLDPWLQTEAQESVQEQVSALADKHVTDGALIALDPKTGDILAMVGSADFYNEEIDGQVNMAISPRQPGSAIKPLTYAAAFEKGWTASTLIWDVPSEFPPSGDENDPRDPYIPVNYDGRFHGPVTVRTALANSYNIPAVKALQFVGIYDDPATAEQEGLIAFARRMGITTLNRNDYGLALTLGGGEVTLLDLTSAFSVFADAGIRNEPRAITKILDYQGNVIYQSPDPTNSQVIRADQAYLITSILSDNKARSPMFGTNSVLNLPFDAAVKTGTTNDSRDNWTVGYTPDLAVGVWVGNADNSAMEGTSGITGAAPIWAEFMQKAELHLTNNFPSGFTRPADIEDHIICAISGTAPSDKCPDETSEIFAKGQPPLDKNNDLWKTVRVDTWTNLLASDACGDDFVADKYTLNVSDKWAIKWIREDSKGQAWAEGIGFSDPVLFTPSRACEKSDSRPMLEFTNLVKNQTIVENPLSIYAIVNASSGFKDFYLEYGLGEKPSKWKKIVPRGGSISGSPQELLSWDLSEIPSGPVVLRLVIESKDGGYARRSILINLLLPTPTPTETPTMTETPTETPTPTFTETPPISVMTEMPTPTPTETATILP
jgi:1A family penicillin-binding protein